jgi:DNA-directed RNA polymerase, beta subunit/140 kD subunit
VKTYEAIIKGQNIPAPGVPESFKVLLKEMQALCLDMRVLDEKKNEVEITEDLYDANQDMHRLLSGGENRFGRKEENFASYGYTKQEFRDGELVDEEPEDKLEAELETELEEDLSEDSDFAASLGEADDAEPAEAEPVLSLDEEEAEEGEDPEDGEEQ